MRVGVGGVTRKVRIWTWDRGACPWTPDGYKVGECSEGCCYDGVSHGFLACKQTEVAPGVARGENRNPYCATGFPVYQRCTGLLARCDPPPPR